jgi:hypothetical protein
MNLFEIGNKAFADYFNAQSGMNITRTTHNADIGKDHIIIFKLHKSSLKIHYTVSIVTYQCYK